MTAHSGSGEGPARATRDRRPAVIVVGDDAQAVGEMLRELQDRGLRAGAFVGDPATDRDALVEMLTELFGSHS